MKLFLLALGLLGMSLCAGAQTEAERSLYEKTLKKPTEKNTARFLKKYPTSVYAPQVIRLRDSVLFFRLDPEDAAGVVAFRQAHPDSHFTTLADERIRRHNTSAISREQARSIAGNCMDAIGWRKDNVEHILALGDDLSLRILSPDGAQEDGRAIAVYTLSNQLEPPALVLPMEIISPLNGRYYLHFGYTNGDAEYVEVLYSPEDDILQQAMFYGKALPAGDGEMYRIEGQSPEEMEGLHNTAEVNWLCEQMKGNPSLIPLGKADFLTDQAIQWWRERNPRAETSATKLSFGILDKASSLVGTFGKSRKERGKGYQVALFDIRGFTVICAFSKSTGEYSLVWCEPVCNNPRRDKLLNSVYFEQDGTTIALFYYKGSSTFKYRISLASKTLRR